MRPGCPRRPRAGAPFALAGGVPGRARPDTDADATPRAPATALL